MRLAVTVSAALVLIVCGVFAGTYVSYFIVAMRHPQKSPFSITCTQVARPSREAVKVRFNIASAAAKDATFLNFAVFAQDKSRRNVSDWTYALRMRIPAHGNVSTTIAIPLEPDYVGLKFSGVRCNLINAAFADGSQQDYTADTTTFP